MKIKIYIHQYIGGCLDGMLSFSDRNQREDAVCLGSHEFEFEMPDEKEIVAKKISMIEDQIEVMSEAFYRQKHIMEGRIQSLLAIENGSVQS